MLDVSQNINASFITLIPEDDQRNLISEDGKRIENFHCIDILYIESFLLLANCHLKGGFLVVRLKELRRSMSSSQRT